MVKKILEQRNIFLNYYKLFENINDYFIGKSCSETVELKLLITPSEKKNETKCSYDLYIYKYVSSNITHFLI